MLSGISDSYNKLHKKRIEKEIKENGGQIKIIKSKMVVLDSLKELNKQEIDFISIDTEGNELNILKSISFNKLNIKCIVVENNYNDDNINNVLIENNFKLIYKLDTDQVFINVSKYNFSIKSNLFLWKLKLKIKRLLK
jgi:maleate cis-trans isomerase